jgi:hypothetical protein
MNNDVDDFEDAALTAVQEVLARSTERLDQAGLSPRVSRHRKGLPSQTVYESEARIEFWDDKTLRDLLEFFMFRHGKPNISIPEIREWLEISIDDVVNSSAKH